MDSSRATTVEARMEKAEEKLRRCLSKFEQQQEKSEKLLKSISEKMDCLIRGWRVSKPRKGNYHRRSLAVNDCMSYLRHWEAETSKVEYFVGKGGGPTKSLEKFKGTEKETPKEQKENVLEIDSLG